jgi:hypothetical protein
MKVLKRNLNVEFCELSKSFGLSVYPSTELISVAIKGDAKRLDFETRPGVPRRENFGFITETFIGILNMPLARDGATPFPRMNGLV